MFSNVTSCLGRPPARPLIWNPLGEPAAVDEARTFMLGEDIWKDINQIMWKVTTDNPFIYPIPSGFRLDVDVDYSKEGKQDAHEKLNKDSRTELSLIHI